MAPVKARSQEAVLDGRGYLCKIQTEISQLARTDEFSADRNHETLCVCVEGTELALLAHNFWFWSVLCSVA